MTTHEGLIERRALAAANEKYKRVARIEARITWSNASSLFVVYDADGFHQGTSFDTLEEAVEECRRLDNQEPADRQI